ncbi:hypothetical protein [Paenisporosarcina sp. NPDC076898]|uniref:hypothetical protein n=1 Tax=unclassified Paenisporosarcina TaxID=2642018 RepID=UPI003D082ECE
MKLFDDTILNDVFDSVATEIKVNEIMIPAIVTNGTLNKNDEQESKHLHTVQKVNQGDVVEHEGNKYLIVTESISKRHNKYKNIMEHCNAALTVISGTTKVIVDYDDLGRPIYDDIEEVYEVPCVIGFNRIGSPNNTGGMMVLQNSLMAKISKNDDNVLYVKVNNEYTVEGKKYKVSHIDNVQTGLLIVQMDYIV